MALEETHDLIHLHHPGAFDQHRVPFLTEVYQGFPGLLGGRKGSEDLRRGSTLCFAPGDESCRLSDRD